MVYIVNSRDIHLNLKRSLVEVRHETSEAVFEVLGSDGVLETYKVGAGRYDGIVRLLSYA